MQITAAHRHKIIYNNFIPARQLAATIFCNMIDEQKQHYR